MRLYSDAILRPQHVEIECGHDGGERGTRGLVAANLQSIGAFSQMIGVVDHPARKPKHLALECGKHLQLFGIVRACNSRGLGHRRSELSWLRYAERIQRLSLAMLVVLSGASSTVLQASGKSASMTGLAGLDGLDFTTLITLSENQ